MSFAALEASSYQSKPLRLYTFRLGTSSWNFASGDRNLTIGGVSYIAVPISDDGSTRSGDPSNEDMKVTLPDTAGIVQLYRGTPPSEEVYVTIRDWNYGDPQAQVTWVGTVSAIAEAGPAKAEIVCRMLTASFDKNGLRLAWGRMCPHALYDSQCSVNKALHGVTMQISALTGERIFSSVLTAYANKWFAGGFVEWTTTHGYLERRAIEDNADNRIRLLGTSDGLTVGQWITAYPGCARTISICVSKFNNVANYGGFPHLPGKSPFQGDPIF